MLSSKKTSNHSSKIPQEHQRTTPCSSSGPSQMPQIDLIGAKGDDRCCCSATRPLVRSSIQNGEDDAEHNTLGTSRTGTTSQWECLDHIMHWHIPFKFLQTSGLPIFKESQGLTGDWSKPNMFQLAWYLYRTKVYPSKYVTTKNTLMPFNAIRPYVCYLNHIFLLVIQDPCFVFTSPSVLNESQHFCPALVALTMAAARVMTSTTWSPSKEVQYNRLPPCSGIIVDGD